MPLSVATFTATGSTVNFALNYPPVTGSTLMVVRNTGIDYIVGVFDNLAHGQEVTMNYGGVAYRFVANYFGGTGNDLVLQWADVRPMAWGFNGFGQLGTDGTGDSPVPAEVNMVSEVSALFGKTVVAMSAGSEHTLALCSDGTVVAWGGNSHGQLGNNDPSLASRLVPVVVNADSGISALFGKTVIAIAAGGKHSLALCSDGTVVSWGLNTWGQLGNGNKVDSLAPGGVINWANSALVNRTVVALAAGEGHSLALCSDGTVAAWGLNSSGQLGNSAFGPWVIPVPVNLGGPAKAIAAGKTHSLALFSEGTVAAWGLNSSGQLGDATTTTRFLPVLVNTMSGVSALFNKTVVGIAAGQAHSLALCSDGSLASWGFNSSGQLGNNSTATRTAPVSVNRSSGSALAGKVVTAVAAGSLHSIARCSDGTVAAWGANATGELGDNSTSNRLIPVAVSTAPLVPGGRFTVGTSGPNAGFSLGIVAAPPPAPTIASLAATLVTANGATLNGTVIPNGLPTSARFNYGPTIDYGSTTTSQDVGSGASGVPASRIVTGLAAHTLYHYQLVASNSSMATNSIDATFTTLNTNPTAPNGAAAATTGDQKTITLPFPGTDADGDPVTVTSITPGPHLAVDNTDLASVTFSPETTFVGETTIDYAVEDGFGGTAAGTITVTVTDNDAPQISGTPANQTLEAVGAAGTATTFGGATAADNVTVNPTVSYSPESGSVFPVGTNTVTVMATDEAGNTGTTTFTVTAQDTIAPTIMAPEGGFAPIGLTVAQGGMVALPNYLAQATIADLVGVVNKTQEPAAGSPIGEGTTMVTLRALDAAGHETTHRFDVMVRVTGSAALAQSGAEVPGAGVDPRIPVGSTWGTFGVPSITMNGAHAGWAAAVRVPPRGSFTGIFTGPILAPTLRAKTGDLVADANGTAVPGVMFKSFREPVFAGDDYAVIATVTGGGAARDTGIWCEEGGTLREIAREGRVAAGTSAKFKAFTSVAMPAPGVVFLVATLASSKSIDGGLWVWTRAAGLQLGLREGDMIDPGTGPVALKALRTLTGVKGSPGHGRYDAQAAAVDVLLLLNGGDMAVARVDADAQVMLQRATGTLDQDGHTLVHFGVPSTPAGLPNTTVLATLALDRANQIKKANNTGIFDLYKVLFRARAGEVAPGAGTATFKSFLDPVTGVSANGGAVQAFAATLTGAPRASDTGIWSYTPGGLQLVAREGTESSGAPGTRWKTFTSLSVLDGRGVMFIATLASGTAKVSAKNDTGLWATDSDGALQLIIREGGEIQTGKFLRSFDVLEFVAGSSGQRRAWTAGDPSGRVIYRAFFTDGTSAILSTAVP